MVVNYNPKRSEVIANPFPVLRQLQAEDPVHWSDPLGSWVLTRYDDVKTSLNDPRLSSDRISPFLEHQPVGGRPELQELGRAVGMWAVFTDPPTHTRLRGLMDKAFTPRAVERLRPRIEHIVARLIDRVQAQGQMDLIRDFAYPLPVTVIAELIGVPEHDHERFKLWSDELASFIGSAVATPDKYDRAGRSMAEMRNYFSHMLTMRRTEPQGDMMSGLIVAAERRGDISEDELIATCVLLLFAGHETTTNLIGNGVLALLRNPDQLQRWREDPRLTRSAVEELLRYDAPTPAMVRVAIEDIEIEDKRIKHGDRIFAMINAANRDPRHFKDPDRLDLRRTNNRHLTFGYGIHFCLGAPLARLEAQLAIPALLRRLPDLELSTDNLQWLDSLIFRGVKSLPVSFRC